MKTNNKNTKFDICNYFTFKQISNFSICICSIYQEFFWHQIRIQSDRSKRETRYICPVLSCGMVVTLKGSPIRKNQDIAIRMGPTW